METIHVTARIIEVSWPNKLRNLLSLKPTGVNYLGVFSTRRFADSTSGTSSSQKCFASRILGSSRLRRTFQKIRMQKTSTRKKALQ
jgi:hypothetical protein